MRFGFGNMFGVFMRSGAVSLAPVVTISSPSPGASVYALSDGTATWSAAPSLGRSIVSVDVYLGNPGTGGRLLYTGALAAGSVAFVPEWSEAGPQSIYVIATDDLGDSSTSILNFTVATSSETAVGVASVGPFDTGNYLSLTAAGSDLTVSNSISILFERTVMSVTSVLWHASTATTGWLLQVSNNGGIVLGVMGGGNYTLGYSNPGRNCVTITRQAGGALRGSLNGAAAVLLNANPTIVTNTAAAINRIGRWTSPASPATAIKLIELAHVANSLTDAEMVAISGIANSLTDRNRLPDSIRLHANLTYRAHADDYDAGTGILIGRDNAGVQSIAWAETGTVAKNTEPDMLVFPEQAHWWNDTTVYSAATVGGVAFHRKNTLSRVKFTTDAVNVEVSALSDIAVLSRADLGSTVAGAFLRPIVLQQSSKKVYTGNPMVAGSKVCELWDGMQSMPSTTATGTHIIGILAPSTAAFSVVTPVPPAKRALWLVDSIGVGDSAIPSSRDGMFSIVRLGWAGGITLDGWGYGSLFDHTCTGSAVDSAKVEAAAQRLAGGLDGTAWNLLGIEVMTNDFGVDQISHTLYQAALEALLDRIHVLRPSAIVVVRLASTRLNETTPNASGSTLPQFRTAALAVVAARAAWCTSVDPMAAGGGPLTFPTHFAADQLHTNTAGHALEGAWWIAWLLANGG